MDTTVGSNLFQNRGAFACAMDVAYIRRTARKPTTKISFVAGRLYRVALAMEDAAAAKVFSASATLFSLQINTVEH